MLTNQIRQRFLEFFAAHGHKVVPSSPLVPMNDPTLLFTNAGMVQFKDVFLGRDTRGYTRAATAQRCVRAGGKHNDLENVGYTARHHTFFEMLGNFSFGDYFKADAIRFAWKLLTEEFKLPPEKLWVTVYVDDDEAASIWLDEIHVDPKRFVRIGDKPGGRRFESDNFWSMGDTGPCGPCSEIFYDHGPDISGGPPGSDEAEGDRFVEIWNLVFMQFDRDADGNMAPLPKPCVDTGMGIERIAAVLQGVHGNYDIDLFRNLIAAAAKVLGVEADTDNSSLRVIADHIRACAFLIVDGVLPANEGRGYVLRRIIRRAVRHGHKLGVDEPFLYKLVAAVEKEMGAAYPELKRGREQAEKVLFEEEQQFAKTLTAGMAILNNYLSREVLFAAVLKRGYPEDSVEPYFDGKLALDAAITTENERVAVEVTEGLPTRDRLKGLISQLKERNFDRLFLAVVYKETESDFLTRVSKLTGGLGFPIDSMAVLYSDLAVPGEVVFKLYDTYGFPVDLTADVARESGFSIDVTGFEREMEKQRERARAASKFAGDYVRLDIGAETAFTGYESLEGEGKVVALFRGEDAVETLEAGDKGVVVLDATPFYAESGGQVGDRGRLYAGTTEFRVDDTQKHGHAHAHIGQVTHGAIALGQNIHAEVDGATRQATVLNHSATHLLHAALRRILGEHVVQKGSLVAPDRLRFDFSHSQALTAEQLRAVETLVNTEIRRNVAAETKVMTYDEAIGSGAIALFGEKYGDKVRVLRLGEFSTELCGGTHVARSGDIGLFKIIAETGIAAGIRRIEALTGERAVAWVEESEAALEAVADVLKASRDDVTARAVALEERAKRLEREVRDLQAKLANREGGDLASRALDIDGLKVLAARLDGADARVLREAVDQLKNKLGSAAVVLAAVDDGKVRLVAGVTKDRTKAIPAGELVNAVAEQVGGRGGGRPDMAQAGGTAPEALDAALESVPDWVRRRLAG
ncbi:MAG TPA: alanine--tRNA ligase [Gammaproteobacteria bacterium]|nr:alanine--tRNA ligase [Gammaproteobacteria bacterium]